MHIPGFVLIIAVAVIAGLGVGVAAKLTGLIDPMTAGGAAGLIAGLVTSSVIGRLRKIG